MRREPAMVSARCSGSSRNRTPSEHLRVPSLYGRWEKRGFVKVAVSRAVPAPARASTVQTLHV